MEGKEMEAHIKDHVYGVILSGGAGTRLWPLSRELSPKQILHLFGTDSLIRQTITRLTKRIPEDHIFIVTGERLFEEIRNHLLTEFPPCKNVQYILEPAARNTAPAIALAAWDIMQKDPEAILGVFPSDHYITDDQPLLDALEKATEVARDGYLVTFGLLPDRPETGFGYLEQGEPLSQHPGVFRAARFIEKPDLEKAKELIQDPRHLWNSGMFVFSARVLLEEVERYLPELHQALGKLATYSSEDYERFAQQEFCRAPAISLDYGIMERSDRVALIPPDPSLERCGQPAGSGRILPQRRPGQRDRGSHPARGLPKQPVVFRLPFDCSHRPGRLDGD